ncbi:MAG TPA: formate dehydrogenase subunit gamma [Burkholderiales bacterium]|nr:formate dehydrogenase subunit gamma [Burkholderiales bacterium]
MQIAFRLIGGVVLALALASPVAAQTQNPAPPTDTAKEQQKQSIQQPGNNAPVWREVVSGQPNYSSLPGREMGVLIQSQARFPGQDAMTTAGEAWRKFRNGPVTFYGGWLLVLVILGIAAFYFVKGPLKLHEPMTGRQIERFKVAERWTHWMVAISFCVMALTGIIILFGKHFLLPILGYTLFAWLTTLAKYLHNFIAPLFMVSLLVMIAMFAKDNLYQRGDFGWLLNGWKMFTSGKHVPSWRFNMGEKVYFWAGVVGLCLVLSVTGAIMLFPNFEQVRSTMQQANILHAISAVVMTVFALGHIYVGTIGVQGAYDNMRHGYTDETWAKEHHEYWYNEVKSGKAATEPQSAAKPGASPQVQT